MKFFTYCLAATLAILLVSCGEEDQVRQAETLKYQKYNDSILKIIDSHWRFAIPSMNPKTSQQTENWNEWQQFRDELAQKPTGSLTAYRQKTKNLVTKAEQLKSNIPQFFNKPQVRSRIGVIIIKMKSLSTYINLDAIPDKKVTALISEITRETVSMQSQLDELIRISEIPKEMGEEEMLRALDTVRMANPALIPMPQTSAPQTTIQRKPGVSRNRILQDQRLD